MLPSPPRASYNKIARLSWHNSRAMNKPKSRAAFSACKEGLEYAVHRLRLDAGATIADFQIGTIAGVQSTQLDLNIHSVASLAILHGVIA